MVFDASALQTTAYRYVNRSSIDLHLFPFFIRYVLSTSKDEIQYYIRTSDKASHS